MYVRALDYGTPLVRKAATLAVSFALVLTLALPVLAVAAQIVA